MKLNEDLINTITQDLVRHEGIVLEIYLDTEGLHTCGVGHLIKLGDEEFKKPVGTPITEERALELFKQDLAVSIKECETLFPNLGDYPDPVQRVLVNMTFNLGRPRLSKFKRMIAAVEAKDWNAAADEMVNSRWYRQTKTRAVELVERMRSAASEEVSD